jgi:crossover junction endodeoxyribonuclease RuvC
MRIIGIDPGKSGAVAVIDQQSHSVIFKQIVPTIKVGKSKQEYDLQGMREILLSNSDDTDAKVFIERQQARPGQGVSSMFTTGKGYGMWLGLCAGLQIPIEVVSPLSWTKEVLRGVPGEGKGRNILGAKRLFPSVDLRKSERSRVPHDGICDAILIAEYGWRVSR